MTCPQAEPLELREYQPAWLPHHAIDRTLDQLLQERYAEQIDVEAPSFRTGYQWKLTAQGWAGFIPLTPDFGIRLVPKVAIGNLLGMLEYAYRLKQFKFLPELIGCATLDDFYERLAHVLARRVLDRGRKGYYRDYLPQEEQLAYVRGRLDVARTATRPWEVRPHCQFQEHTADIEDNQLLAWTLWHITRRGVCSERVLPAVRQAYRSLAGLAHLEPFAPAACTGRRYNRLNQDYHPLHALCRFFLEQSGPSHAAGERETLPFLVNMEGLFEMFVAEWLKAHLPPRWSLRAQERYTIGGAEGTHFDIDLVLYDNEAGAVRCVLDTKYKAPDTPAAHDIQQVVSYAEVKQCREAVLIYPAPLPRPIDSLVGPKIRVRTATFSLAGDLEAAGRAFVQELLGECDVMS